MFKAMIGRPSFSFALGVGIVVLTLIVPVSGWTQNSSRSSSVDLKEPGAPSYAGDWFGQSPLIDDVEPDPIALAPRATGAIPAVPFYDPLIAGLLTDVDHVNDHGRKHLRTLQGAGDGFTFPDVLFGVLNCFFDDLVCYDVFNDIQRSNDGH